MLDRLKIKNITVFEEAEITFTKGINVFIGANATGKTHAMKLAYCLVKSAETTGEIAGWGKGWLHLYAMNLTDKLTSIFRLRDGRISYIIRHVPAVDEADLELDVNGVTLVCEQIGKDECKSVNAVDSMSRRDIQFPSSVFLPAREVLSMYPGFIAAYQKRELSFDETYYDLCIALNALPLRGPRNVEAVALSKPLSEHLRSNVFLHGDSFYLESEDDGIIEAHLVAEGHRKIATLMHLIANGSLAKGSVLFWDEPEANLNPRLIKVVADFLLKLAANGIQIIIATHDYLLTNELSLQAEYQTEAADAAPIRFFAFDRGEGGGVTIESGATLAELSTNPIMEEFEALYDRERRLFHESDRVPE